jgi:hypothetical protein
MKVKVTLSTGHVEYFDVEDVQLHASGMWFLITHKDGTHEFLKASSVFAILTEEEPCKE